jgi:hypothetical protein
MWVLKIKKEKLTVEHIKQFVKLWTQLQMIQLIDDIEDGIIWTLSSSGRYSAAFAHTAQFFDAFSTDVNKMVWKI